MTRFRWAVAAYLTLCLLAIAAVLLHGDGPYPRLVATYPAAGDRFWPGGVAQLTFNHFMDQSSVERALQVTPGGQGQGIWTGTTLNIQPLADWKPDVTYRVELTGTVTDDQGRRLPTPITFWFRVHHVRRLGFCPVDGVRNVCELLPRGPRPLTHERFAVQQYALSPDGTTLAYTAPDRSRGPTHLFDIETDGTGRRQLTRGSRYADSGPFWSPGDNSSISYDRRPLTRIGEQRQPQLWNINVDGSGNARL